MAHSEMFQVDNQRPTQRKENRETILKKIAEDVEIHKEEIERLKKEAHHKTLLLRPNGKEIIEVEEKYDDEISKVEKEIQDLTDDFNREVIKETLPVYKYDKARRELKDNHTETLNNINEDIKRKERALIVKTINRPKREFERELAVLEKAHKAAVRSIKRSKDLGKIAISEEVEHLENEHQKVVDELQAKYQESIDKAEAELLTKEDIKDDLDALKEELQEKISAEKELYASQLNEIVKPDTKEIRTVEKELKKVYKINVKEKRAEIKTLLANKKAAVSEVEIVELSLEEEKEIKAQTKAIRKEIRQLIVREKQEIKKVRGFRPRKLTYDRRKVLFGLVFAAPWILGFFLLFAYPLVQSFYYSFFELTPAVGEIQKEFVGFANYIFAFQEHIFGESSFKIEILNTLQESLINLLVLVIFSLFIAVLLNHEFRGRAIVRAIFFIPVILNSSAVSIALSQGGTLTDLLLQESAVGVFDLGEYLMGMGIGASLITFLVGLIGRIYNIITLSGVPILLFLAAIQSVPNHLYEAATIEGATGYEQFWLITLPNVSPHIITVSIYAIVDTFLTSSVSTIITTEFNLQQWGLSSAMSWVYVFLIIGILGLLAILAKIFKIGESHYEKEK